MDNSDSSLTDFKPESLLDSRSLEQTWSFLDLPSSGTSTIDEDPNQSKTAAQSQQAHCKHLYRQLVLIKQVGEGAVFQVGLYKHRDGRQFAVKHAKLGGKRRDGGNNPAGGIFSALREIQVNFQDALKRHENIVEILGWDWSEKRVPVILTEYAENGTLRDFVQAHSTAMRSRSQSWDTLRRGFALDVAAGLSALHASDIAHGDVKLENTLVFTHPKRQWCAKVSDFSHAVFGISTKRKSTYPGSGLYNAPEIRRRSAVITSDLLPRCETFSYGLLVWELVKDGECFFDTNWSRVLNATEISNSILEGSRIQCLESLPPNALLDHALAFLGTCSSIPPLGRSLFALVFEHCLKDRSPRRSDMSTIATMLDYEDRDFSPWAKGVPWMTQVQTVQEFERLLDDFVGPDHAEWYLLLSRCYAEGFGVKIDYEKMLFNLHKAAQYESVEAAFMLLLIEDHFPRQVNTTLSAKPTAPKAPLLVDGAPLFDDTVKMAMQAIQKAGNLVPSSLRYISMIQAWHEQNSFRIRQCAFNFQGNTYFWTHWNHAHRFLENANTSQFSIWFVVITFESLDSTLQTEGFFQACASIGAVNWWTSAMEYAINVQNIGQDEREVVIYNSMIAAFRNGQYWGSLFPTLLEQIEPGQRVGFASRVTKPNSKTPLHFFAFAKDGGNILEGVARQLAGLGFDALVNQAVSTRTWLPPLGIELHGTALHMAVRLRSLPAVKALIGMGANPTETSAVDPRSPLELAINLHLPKIVDYMINNTSVHKDCWSRVITAVGNISPKGTFDTWLLHPGGNDWPNALHLSLLDTLIRIQSALGTLSDCDGREICLRSLSSGWKSTPTFQGLWKCLESSHGKSTFCHNHRFIRDALDLIAQIIHDDPVNRDILRFLFSQSAKHIDWKVFLKSNVSHSGEFQAESMLSRWIKLGMAYNLEDVKVEMSSSDWDELVKLPDENGVLPIEAAISCGSLATYELLAAVHEPDECLTRALDLCAEDVVAHIIRCDTGTIFCDTVRRRTALHHAAATSNITMIRFLMGLKIPWSNRNIRDILTKTNSIRRAHTVDLRVFKWEPIFSMVDLYDNARTALDIAADRNDNSSIEALLDFERDYNTDGSGDISENLLSAVVRSGRVNVAKTLLQRFESPYCVMPWDPVAPDISRGGETDSMLIPKWSFIYHATYHAAHGEIHLSVLERFLMLCKDKEVPTINGTDYKEFWQKDRLWNGWLPIHYAIYCGGPGIVESFLAAEIWSPDDVSMIISASINVRDEMKLWSLAFDYETLFRPAAPSPQGLRRGNAQAREEGFLDRYLGGNKRRTGVVSEMDAGILGRKKDLSFNQIGIEAKKERSTVQKQANSGSSHPIQASSSNMLSVTSLTSLASQSSTQRLSQASSTSSIPTTTNASAFSSDRSLTPGNDTK